jgi:hypothetical protein
MASSSTPMLRLVSSVVVPLLYPFSTSYRESGEYMLHGLLNSTKGAFAVGSKGESKGITGYLGSEEARKKLWEHTVETTRV